MKNVINFFKKIFGKKEPELFDSKFINKSKTIINLPKGLEPYNEKVKKTLQMEADPSLFAKSLKFDMAVDDYVLSELSDEARQKVIDIIKQDFRKK